ncbi:MAG: hypothetical protein WKF85_03440 [Chitinophagaceae bacterium]
MRNENNQQKNIGLTFKEAYDLDILEVAIKNCEDKKQKKLNSRKGYTYCETMKEYNKEKISKQFIKK